VPLAPELFQRISGGNNKGEVSTADAYHAHMESSYSVFRAFLTPSKHGTLARHSPSAILAANTVRKPLSLLLHNTAAQKQQYNSSSTTAAAAQHQQKHNSSSTTAAAAQ
jgi:hypothetical protein